MRSEAVVKKRRKLWDQPVDLRCFFCVTQFSSNDDYFEHLKSGTHKVRLDGCTSDCSLITHRQILKADVDVEIQTNGHSFICKECDYRTSILHYFLMHFQLESHLLPPIPLYK